MNIRFVLFCCIYIYIIYIYILYIIYNIYIFWNRYWCYAEQGNEVWAGGKGRARRCRRQRVGTTQDEQPTRQRDDCPTQPPSSSYTGPVTRQRSRRMNK